ncbi:MAG: PIN domain-containing protein [Pyrinomonadaceae bacterium]|nr:PIN domain-containing protein [Acidobacteriota bacterium]MDQ3754656.1 PIN domain-containing protein [Acidobacteriota bacterium]
MNAVDTNILIYVHDNRDPRKQAIAESLVRNLSDAVLLWQVACEYIAASRKLEPFGYNREKAWIDLHKLEALWTPVLPTWAMLQRTEDLMKQYKLSSWDALIIAACLEASVTRLYSEDFDASARATGLGIVNPFATP